MKSPITNKPMKLVSAWKSVAYRKDEFKIKYHNYSCEDSGELFTDDVLDELNMTQVYNQYREKYGIPYKEDIIRIRKKYEISSAKISEILGFGTNTYRLYEAGEVPSVSNGRIIQTIEDPEEFTKQVKLSSHLLGEKEINKLINKAIDLQKTVSEALHDLPFSGVPVSFAFTGYKKLNPDKILGIIQHLSPAIELFKTKLNKLLFYADFMHFKESGFSITGLSYRAIDLGPVPAQYDLLYSVLIEKNKIGIQNVLFENGNYGEVIVPNQNEKNQTLDDSETKVLTKVIGKFGSMSSKKIVELSHKEKAWIENEKTRSLISYKDYGFDLNF